MDKEELLSQKLTKISEAIAEFSKLAIQSGEAAEKGDPIMQVASIIGTARKARKAADAFMDYAETLEDMFNL